KDFCGELDFADRLRGAGKLKFPNVDQQLKIGDEAFERPSNAQIIDVLETLDDFGLYELRQAVAPLPVLERQRPALLESHQDLLGIERDERRGFRHHDLTLGLARRSAVGA